jgi:hypothetical protein
MDMLRSERNSALNRDAVAAAAPTQGNAARENDDRIVETSIPSRLDSLRWSRSPAPCSARSGSVG